MKLSRIIPPVFAALCMGCSTSRTLEVENRSDFDRHEIVGIRLDALGDEVGDAPFRIVDSDGSEIPCQLTFDGNLIFPARVGANSTARYTIEQGESAKADTIACGSFHPERKDDLAWENDRAAYRAYGPAIQAAGERSYGYDIWTKSVASPVVSRRYHDHISGVRSYHEDHGDGMDAYTVGPTLGGGTAALIDSVGNILYPWSFSTYEILDNGPLRFTVRLGYEGGETRLISLDAGEFLNRTEVRFPAKEHSTVASGIVIHRQNPDGYFLSPDNCFMAYADLTDNADNGNGVIYIGVVVPEVDSMQAVPLEEAAGDAIGHILAKKSLSPAESFTYWWGSGWSKGAMPDWTTWKQYLADFNKRLKCPLEVKCL